MFSQGAVVMTWSLLLLEAGVRRADDYRLQAYAALAVGACLVADVFLLHGRGITVAAGVDVGQEIARQAWRVLPVAAALAYAFAGRLALHSRGERTVRHAAAAAAAATVGTVFVALFEYRVTPAHALAAIWAGTGAAAAAFGAWRAVDVFRWHGCALAAAGAIVALAPLVLNEVDTRQEYAAAASVIVFTYLAAFVGRRGATGLVASALGGVAFAGNALQTLFVWRVVPADAVAPVWAASAVALVTMGALRRRPEQRWQGYALIVLSTGRALLPFAATSLTTAQTVSSVLVIALAYAASYVGRALPGRAGAAGNAEEQTIAGGLSWLATAHLGIWINEVLPPFAVPACMAASAAGLLVLGVARPRAGQRWQAYGLFAFSGLRLLFELGLAEHGHAAAVVWAALAIAMYFASGLGLRTALRRAAAIEGPQAGDEYARRVLLVGGSILLSVLIADEVGAGLLTLAWALQGAAVLAAGFLMRERVLRLSGLALLFVCILKLFAYDLRQLEALARILSFVVLGLVLLAVSWIYTRYREQIRRLL
jgi:hypothetical protein